MIGALHLRDFTRHGPWHMAFIGGLGLSGIVILALLLVAYFAGTAPHLPQNAAALENMKPDSGSWPPKVNARLLDGAQPKALPAARPATRLSALPRAADGSDGPPIDATDLPPPENR